MAERRVHPVILSGGAGTRLWPLSRELYPKQFFALASDLSLLQETARRVGDPARFSPPLILCNHEHRFIVAEQLREAGIKAQDIVLEPLGRNTAPAAAVAALILAAQARSTDDPLMLLLPSDHVIANQESFLAAVDSAVPAAANGAIVTFGMAPHRAETGYGYVERGMVFEAAGEALEGCFHVSRFSEKPNQATAAEMVESGRWFWNSGMFMASAATLLGEIERFAPDVLTACRNAVDHAARDLDFLRLNADAFTRSPGISLDYAVMEKTDRAAIVPADFGWSDVGAWSALWDAGTKDPAGNVLHGDVITQDVHNSYIRSDHRLVAAIGISDSILVVTDDAVLVAPKERAQDVKALVETLRARGRTEAVSHSRVYRPWGFYESVQNGDRYQVKLITVYPGSRLSLQRHRERAEHWVVVNGTARVTRGEETFLLHENQSTFIPLGTIHRLENPGTELLRLIEVQSGRYLGEDDIERIEDNYGRA